MKNETFLNFSAVDWSAISTIVTFSAVLVALFLPLFFERKKKRNLSRLIEYELERNIKALNNANCTKEGQIEGRTLSKLNMICPMLVSSLDLDIWNDNKQTIAEMSSKSFLKYSAIAQLMEEIKFHAKEINANQGESPYIVLIEGEIEKCLKIYNN